jgi:hypothetical protein
MSKYIHLYYSSLLFILIVFVSIEYHNNNVLESRINSLNKNSIDFKSEKTFKEDFYITQQSRDTTLLLFVFSALVGIIGLFTYTNIVESFRNSIDEIKADNVNQKAERDKYHNNFILLESELNYQTGLIYSERASEFLKINVRSSIVQSLSAMEKFASCIESENYINRKPALDSLYSELEFLNKITLGDFFLIDIDFKIYKKRIERITRVLDNNGTTIFNQIISTIRITE